MRVAVHRQISVALVDRLAQQVVAEESPDLGWFAHEGAVNGRVVGEGHGEVRSLGGDIREGIGEQLAAAPPGAREVLHLRLAEVAGGPSGEAQPEPLGARDPEAALRQVQHHALTLEHDQAGAAKELGNLLGTIAVVVVVAQDSHHRDGEATVLIRHDLRLVDRAVPGEVTGEQQHARVLVDILQPGSVTTHEVRPEMHVSDGGDADHRSTSDDRGGSLNVSSAQVSSSTTSLPGHSSSTRRRMERRVPSLATAPWT